MGTPVMPAQYKASLQTLEGKLALAANFVYLGGIAAAAIVDVATKQAVFSHYANQLTVVSGFLLAFNGWYAKIRSNYKIALADLSAPVNPDLAATT